MNIYEKLALARVELQSKGLRKSGKNTFAKYDYFELADMLPSINELMAKYKMLGVCSFHEDYATLSIFDAEKPDDVIVFKSPMSTAELKGCHPVQNLGAVETYTRRYLWTAAFEIVECDALDSTQGRPTQTDEDPLGTGNTDNRLPARGDNCEICGATLTAAQKALSKQKFGRLLCPACQTKEGNNA